MNDFVIMPKNDYQDACGALREKTGTSDLIRSGQLKDLIASISGGIKDIPSEEELDAQLTEENIGKAYRFVGESTSKYIQNDIYVVEEVI